MGRGVSTTVVCAGRSITTGRGVVKLLRHGGERLVGTPLLGDQCAKQGFDAEYRERHQNPEDRQDEQEDGDHTAQDEKTTGESFSVHLYSFWMWGLSRRDAQRVSIASPAYAYCVCDVRSRCSKAR